MTPLIDAHLHLDLLPDPRRALADLVAAEHQAIAVTNAPSVFEWTQRLVTNAPLVYAALGLHPELAVQRERELPLMWELLPKTRYVGEVGLDYVTRSRSERAAQRRIFEHIVDACDAAGDKILSVHSRRAAADVIKILEGIRGTVILHWFSGTANQLLRAAEAGFFFSINPSMGASRQGRELMRQMPSNQVMTESDAPFAQVDGRPVATADILKFSEMLAMLWGCEPQEVQQSLRRTFEHVTRYAPPKDFNDDGLEWIRR